MSPARVQSRDRNPPDCREEGPHTGPGPLLLTIISAQLRVAPGGSDTDITCRQVKKKNISRPRALDSCHTSLLTTRIRERALHVLRENCHQGWTHSLATDDRQLRAHASPSSGLGKLSARAQVEPGVRYALIRPEWTADLCVAELALNAKLAFSLLLPGLLRALCVSAVSRHQLQPRGTREATLPVLPQSALLYGRP
jgi:hypothetical protein